MEVVHATAQAAVEQREVGTHVPLAALLPCQVGVATEHLDGAVAALLAVLALGVGNLVEV